MNKYQVVKFVDDDFTLDVRTDAKNETVWLTAEEMAKLFGVNRPDIVKHVNKIINSEELNGLDCNKAKEVIDCYFDDYVKNLGDSARIKRAVIFVCQAHGYSLEELIKDERFTIVDRVNSLSIHYGILSFLLRIGDLMDMGGTCIWRFRSHV